MNPRIKGLWVDALRSGEFEQGTGALREGDTYCCLGVLSELYVRDTGCGKWVGGFPYLVFDDGDEIKSGELSRAAALWAGLADGDPTINPNGDEHDEHTATEINDAGFPFTDIADLIEENL